MADVTTLAHPEAERTALGAVLVDRSAWTTLTELVRPKDYADARHRLIHEALEDIAEQGRGHDLVTLREALTVAGKLSEAGGMAYVAGLIDGLPRITNLPDWCALITERSRRRQALAVGKRLQELAAEDAESIDVTLDSAAHALAAMLDSSGSRVDVPIRDAVKGAVARLERVAERGGVTGIPTSLPWLDALTGGWQPGQLIIIAARPACGKSVFLGQAAVCAGTAGYKLRMATLEMSPESVAERLVLGHAEVDRYNIRSDKSWTRIAMSMGIIGSLPIVFDAREAPTVAQLRASSRRQRETHGLDALFVDYLQRVAFDERLEERIGVGRVTRALKSLALGLKIPVICAAQLNRTAEHKEPSLAELAESGAIEREADIVVALHPEPEHKGKQLDFPVTHCIVLKHREGAVGRRSLIFEKRLTRFVDERGGGE